MKQIQGAIGDAPKLANTGSIKYQLWVDDLGSLYVQLTDNNNSGTFSELLFSVSKYASKRNTSESISQPTGYDLADKSLKTSSNNNDGAFLKAVLLHLLP